MYKHFKPSKLKKFAHIHKIALLLGAIFLCVNFSRAQQYLELLEGPQEIKCDQAKDICVLTGNVRFVYGENTLFCDSAVFYQKRNKMRAYGHVHIRKGQATNIFSDSLWFDGTTEIGYLFGHVRARDQEYKLTTDSLEYNTRLERATYRYGGKVESIDGKEVLTSKIGYFYPEKKDFFFKTNVKYKGEDISLASDTLQFSYLKNLLTFGGKTEIETDSTFIYCLRGKYNTQTEEAELYEEARILKETQIIEGDTLIYQPKQKLYIGRGHVFVNDTVERFALRGDYLYKNDSTSLTFLTGHALAIQQKDSLFIHADTLFTTLDSLNKLKGIRANYGVRIFQKDLQGRCDSLNYSKAEKKMELFRDPILWSSKGELKGDTIRLYLNDSLVEKAELFRNATALFQLDTGTYYNQLAGKFMTAYFNEKNEVKKADIIGNAQTIYFPESTENTDSTVVIKRTGMNRLYASRLTVYLDSGEVVGATYKEEPDGKFYPMNQINTSESKVPGFVWKGFLRPKTWEDLFKED